MNKKVKIIIICIISILILLGVSIFVTLNFVSPKITIKGDKKVEIKIDEKYKEKGATAKYLFFNISDKIKITNNINNKKPGKYKVKYEIKSKIIKKKISYREVTVIDDIIPVITLKGDKTIKVYQNGKYEEPGYSALDNVDGDLTNKVEIENKVDLTKIGKYQIIYKVTDSSKNEGTIERTIEVIASPKKTYSGNGLSVLMYHYFYDKSKGEKGENSNWHEISLFEEQVKYLVNAGYYFPTWSEVISFVEGKVTLPKKSVVITSDDGNESFFRLAVPIIQKYNIKATGFIIGSYTTKEYLSNYKSNIYFESHTYNMHRAGCPGMGHGGYFNCVSYSEGLEDLKKSIGVVGDNSAIAYPFGDVNDSIKKITKDAGIKLGFTTKYGKVYAGMDALELPRVRINDGMSMDAFKSIV